MIRRSRLKGFVLQIREHRAPTPAALRVSAASKLSWAASGPNNGLPPLATLDSDECSAGLGIRLRGDLALGSWTRSGQMHPPVLQSVDHGLRPILHTELPQN